MSIHKSLMAPKRSSTRFTVTREEHQLESNAWQLANGIKVTPIPCGSHGERKYRLGLENSTDKICSLDSLAEELSSAGLHVSTVENVLSTLLDVIPSYIAKTGRSVRIGNLMTLKACATGTIDNVNDEPDPERNHLEIRATISPALRHSLAKARLVNVKSRRNVIDRVILNMDGANSDEIDAVHNIYVNGLNIYVAPQSATDEDTRGRVWVETLEGEMLGRCAVLDSGPDLITAKFVPNAPVQAGDARIVVETYGTKEAADAGDKASLARYTRKIRIIG